MYMFTISEEQKRKGPLKTKNVHEKNMTRIFGSTKAIKKGVSVVSDSRLRLYQKKHKHRKKKTRNTRRT